MAPSSGAETMLNANAQVQTFLSNDIKIVSKFKRFNGDMMFTTL